MLLISFAGCKGVNGITKASAITFIKEPCFGKCPAYTFILPNTGKATFIGKKNVSKIGQTSINVPQTKVREIYNQLHELDLKSKKYNARLRDLPEKKLIYGTDTIYIKGRKGVPESLQNFITTLETTVNTYLLKND